MRNFDLVTQDVETLEAFIYAIRQREFARYPKYLDAYIRTFDKMVEERKHRGKPNGSWKTGMDVYRWWMEDDVLPGQMEMEDLMQAVST